MQITLRTLLLSLIASFLVLGAWGKRSEARASSKPVASYALVVNTANKDSFKTDADARSEVKKLFLKNATQWGSGTKAKPFGRKDGDAAQNAFLTEVLGMDAGELARHWISQKNKKGIAPPKEVSSAKMLSKYVGKYDGGFGVLPLEDAKSSGLRILFEF